ARVASGGELSRVMLAIRAAGAESEELPTLVFDEVDAGIGGEAAVQVGLRLKALGARRQVLVVTHLAQIACFADHHLIVEKAPDAGGRHVVRVRELVNEEERARELARMMSGTITDKALARAHELIDEAGSGGRRLRVASGQRAEGDHRIWWATGSLQGPKSIDLASTHAACGPRCRRRRPSGRRCPRTGRSPCAPDPAAGGSGRLPGRDPRQQRAPR